MITEKEAIEKVERVVADRKHANDVVELLSMMENADENIASIITTGLIRFFASTLEDRSKIEDESVSSELQVFFEWVKYRYSEFLSQVAGYFSNPSHEIQRLGILTFTLMIEKELLHPKPKSCQVTKIPEKLIRMLIAGLMSCEQLPTLSREIQDVLKLVDLRYFVMKSILKTMDKCIQIYPKQSVFHNTYLILECISKCMSADASTVSDSPVMSLCDGNLKDIFPELEQVSGNKVNITLAKVCDAKENKKAFSNAWIGFLNQNLDGHTIKRILCLMQKHILPNFSSPCVLSDFLSNCFSQGGGIALLSLHGLFVLMTEHNLEYPNFYVHLYSTVHPRIFDAKYQSRYFYLLDIFLSSTHLPAYLIAAFAKKLARLILVAPSYAQPLLVNFILTLIQRHPSIKVLINRPKSDHNKDALCKGDPYIASQVEPALCNALESSLWELTTLNRHFFPRVSQCVKELHKGPQHEIHELLDESYFDMFDSSTKNDFKEAPMNHVKPTALFGGFEDVTADLWDV